jgi:predicted metal-binding membrane protein
MTNTRRPDRAFIVTAALVFAASTAVTIAWCSSMTAMPGMEMPGGWTMSMTWMRMPGQSWTGAAATFLGMWTVMMIAMMLPALVPMLSRYRKAVRRDAGTQLSALTTIVSAGYFTVWTLCGVAAFPMGLLLAEVAMRVPAVSRAVPFSTGLVVLIAGILQFTAWKKRHLDCCRASPPRALSAGIGTAWRHGVRLGIHCLRCCAGLTAVLLVIGVMDLAAMAVVAAAIAAERLTPAGERVACGIGALTVIAGLYLIATGRLAS